MMDVESAAARPVTLDDLLTLLPGLRRLRSLDAELLRLLLDRGKGRCTWCDRAVPRGRSTWRSEACVSAFKLRCSVDEQRKFVQARDRGICQLCGRDTVAAEREARTRRLTAFPSRQSGEDDLTFGKRKVAAMSALLDLGFARGRWREVDHRTAVAEGGGLCGVGELRLLCGLCHLEETERLAVRRRLA